MVANNEKNAVNQGESYINSAGKVVPKKNVQVFLSSHEIIRKIISTF